MRTTPGVEVRRVLNAAPERVFAAFADPAVVAKWLRPSPDVGLTVLVFDFRPAGAYRFAYDVPDGRRMIVGGTYQAIERPSRIVFSWLIEPPDEHAGIASAVTVTLTPRGDATELVIRHAKFDRADADVRHDEGWRGEALAKRIRGSPPSPEKRRERACPFYGFTAPRA